MVVVVNKKQAVLPTKKNNCLELSLAASNNKGIGLINT